jgi:glutathione peroxidase
MNKEFYQLSIQGLYGEEISMNDFQGKTLLIVNTASKCGLTPQYEGLENLYKEYKDSGLVILGCPCDQFANQEPGTVTDIQFFCTDKYDISFPMSTKIKVNGSDAHPLYKYLKKELKGFLTSNIKWNFTKFLIGPDGKPIKRFGPKTEPNKIAAYIKPLLNRS